MSDVFTAILDLDAVRGFLVERFGPGVGDVTAVHHGHWSRAFTFGCADRGRLVIRFAASDVDFRKDLLIFRNRSRTFPAPEIIEIGAAFDGYYAISRRVEGVHLDELGPRRMRHVLPDLLAGLDAMRGLDLTATTGFGEWRGDGHAGHVSWRSYLLDVGADRPTDRTHGWRHRMASARKVIDIFDETRRRFDALVDACPEQRHLVHGDILNYNVMVGRGAVAAFLDWGWAKYGDFLYDIARLCFWESNYPQWRGIDFRNRVLAHYRRVGVDLGGFDERLRCYQVHVGLTALVHRAFRGDMAGLDAIARRTLALAVAAG